MGLNILELRIGRDILLIAPRGTLHRNAKRIQYNPCSPSTLDRFLRSQDNLDKLRRLWPNVQPLPKMSRLTDQDLARMLKSAVGKSQVEAVIISTATVALPGMDSQRVAQARKIESGAQRNRMQGASSIGMQSPGRGGTAGQMASRGAMATPTASRGATPTVPIAAWPIEQRLQFVVERARKKVPAHTGEALKELVSPESIGLMVGLIAVGGLAQLTPVGWAVDAALIGLAFVFGGLAAVHALGEMVECFQAIKNAKSEADLDRAADALSRAVVGIGLVALIALLHRVAKGNKGGGGSKKGGSAPEQAPPPRLQESAQRRPQPPLDGAQKQSSAGKLAAQEEAVQTQSASGRGGAGSSSENPSGKKLDHESGGKDAEATPMLIAYRRGVAREFFEKQLGLKNWEVEDLMKGIDFTKPVEIVDIPPPATMSQHVRKGKEAGNWFNPDPKQSADSLGLNGDPKIRDLKTFQTPPGKALRSTAAPVVDNWTDKANALNTKGGGIQMTVPNSLKSKFVEI